MSHTPGPWKVDPQPNNRWNVMHEIGLFYWTLNETEDNARVVAAAPKLLMACESHGESGGIVQDGPELLERAAGYLEAHGLRGLAPCLRRKAQIERDAIASARGEVICDDPSST